MKVDAMSIAMKRVLHWGGGMLAVFGVLFVALRFREYNDQLDFSRLSAKTWLLIVGLALTYSTASLALSMAWRNILKYLGTTISRPFAIGTHGISQLAKYVPGNIFHLAGRQAIGMAAGIPAMSLAKSTVWELGLLTLAGSLCAGLTLPLIWSAIPVMLSLIIVALVIVATCSILRHFFDSNISKALVFQVIFLLVSGVVFAIFLYLSSSVKIPFIIFPALCGAYTIAWLVGFVTPGSPAGVGVRELVLLFLLKTIVVESELLLVVVLGRATTVLGDLCYFSIATLIGSKK